MKTFVSRAVTAGYYVTLGTHRLGNTVTSRQQRLLLAASLVSFDVFDTAVLRSIARPADVHSLAAWRWLQRRTDAKAIEDIDSALARTAGARSRAERVSRERAAVLGIEEVSLDDIYACFDDSFSALDRDQLKAEELWCEQRLVVANPVILALYALLTEHAVPVIFTSDTYFSPDIVRALLHNSGYSEPLAVITSASFRKTKRSGSLFAEVHTRPRRPTGAIYHIGDNLAADVLNARKAHIRGMWYRPALRSIQRHDLGPVRTEAQLARSVAAGLRATQPSPADDRLWASLGSEIAFPLLFGFCQWLAALVQDAKPARVLFCARDGLALKRLYDEIARAGPALPPSAYLEVSRRTLAFPSVERMDVVDVRFLSRSMMPIPVAKYLTRIGLSVADAATEIEAAQLSPTERITSKDPRLAVLLRALAPIIIARAQTERQMLLRYLETVDCLGGKPIALCDVGWHGSLQRALERLLDREHIPAQICGYYIGAFPDDLTTLDKGPMYGWLADKTHTKRVKALYRCVEIIELITTADHGSVAAYEQHAGAPAAIYEPQDDDGQARSAVAQLMQSQAAQLTHRYLELFAPFPAARIGAADAFAAIRRLVDRPSLAEVRAIGRLKHIDSFAATQSQAIVELPQRGKPLRQLRAISVGYKHSLWPRAYLVALFGNARLGIAVDRFYLYARSLRHRTK